MVEEPKTYLEVRAQAQAAEAERMAVLDLARKGTKCIEKKKSTIKPRANPPVNLRRKIGRSAKVISRTKKSPVNQAQNDWRAHAKTPAMTKVCSICGHHTSSTQKLREHTSAIHLPARVSRSGKRKKKFKVKASVVIRSAASVRPCPPNVSPASTKTGARGTTLSLVAPNLDASREWSGAFRDHGQFGSHPSFDSMDDEAMA